MIIVCDFSSAIDGNYPINYPKRDRQKVQLLFASRKRPDAFSIDLIEFMNKPQPSVIKISRLRPTQISVGFRLVKYKRMQLRALDKRPAELVDFILEHPIRVVRGPKERVYVIDHHHLALALLRERFETAPMNVEEDFSTLNRAAFWQKMQTYGFVHAYNAEGQPMPLTSIPDDLELMTDDPYRSLAGFVRETGFYKKVSTPYAEFVWADFYRKRIKQKVLKKHFNKALKRAKALAQDQSARKLPGFLNSPVK